MAAFARGRPQRGIDRVTPTNRDSLIFVPPSSVEQALRSLSIDPFSGLPLAGGLTGLWRIRIRRFRIIYEPDRKARAIRIFAIGHRRQVYEEIAEQLRREKARR